MKLIQSNSWRALLCLVLLIFVLVALAGCATTDNASVAPTPPPPGCEKSLFWKYQFMPYGPGISAAAVEMTLIAEPSVAKPMQLILVEAWFVTKTGNITEIKKVLRKDKVARFFVPPLTLIEQWEKAGLLTKVKVGEVEQVQLDPCDKTILLNMIQDAALSAGAKPEVFE